MADQPYEHYYAIPPKLGKWKRIRILLWNSKTGQFLGRTTSSWAKILVFYFCFHAILIGLSVAVWVVFYQTLDMKIPKWQLDESLIGTNPGLGFRPMPPEALSESTLVWFKKADPRSQAAWTKRIDDFLKPYKKMTLGGNVLQCDYNKPPTKGKVCFVDVKSFHPCTEEQGYGYSNGTPCVFLKLNKIYNWTPKTYTKTGELPEKAPRDLKDHILAEKKQSPATMNTVWVSCEGEHPADVENIGTVQYFPKRGFPGYFYPYEKQDLYLSPIVAVRFERPTTGVLISVECKAWAKNIIPSRAERRGSVHFELMVN